MSYARHILNITEIIERITFGTCYHCWWFWGTFKFFSLISSCVLYLLSSYLFWTELEVDLWHWSTLFIMTIHTHAYTRSVQNRVTAKQISSFFLPPDELWWLNYSVWWPKVIDQPLWVVARLTDFVVVFQLRRCHSIFSCCLHYSLHSAILSWKK